MKWIGLTGGIGSGKSSVTRLLRAKSHVVVDADELARAVVEPGTPGLAEVVQHFGPRTLTPDGRLDRKALAALVFGQGPQLIKLESLLHPRIQNEARRLREEARAQGHKMAFYDVPLLFEKNLVAQFDAVLLVWCRPEQQVERAILRTGLSESEIRLRMRDQIPLDEKRLRSDVVIDNSGPPEALEAAVDKALQELARI